MDGVLFLSLSLSLRQHCPVPLFVWLYPFSFSSVLSVSMIQSVGVLNPQRSSVRIDLGSTFQTVGFVGQPSDNASAMIKDSTDGTCESNGRDTVTQSTQLL